MSKNTEARKNVQINATVSAETHDAIRKYRFANEIEMVGDVVKLAVVQFLEREGIAVEDAPAAE